MTEVHSTAVVHPGAELGSDVYVGPYCIVGGKVTLGDRVRLESHVVVEGRTTVGADCHVQPFAAIGTPPQDLKYGGEDTELRIGQRTRIREHATLHPGTRGGGMLTSVGDDCLLMVGVHVAHDCQVGNHVVMVNNATLGGHVKVAEHAIIGGMSAVHQFVRIGQHAMIGGMSGVEGDVIPYGMVIGNRARLTGLNIVGLKRRGFTRDQIHDLRNAYRLLFAEEGTLQERLADVAEMFADRVEVMEMVRFLQSDSSRALCQPKIERAA